MKNILIIGLLTFSMKAANAQTGIPDTLAYLNSIVANKTFFIGKPFSVLADSLKPKLGIKYFSPFGGIHYNAALETSTICSFYFLQGEHEMYLTYPQLEIYWQPYLNKMQSLALYKQHDGSWSPAVAAHDATGIIADIKIRE